MVVWPTITPAGDGPSSSAAPLGLPTAAPHRPVEGEGATFARAQELDATLRDAVQDLGFALKVTDGGPVPGRFRDADLLLRAATPPGTSRPEDEKGPTGTWVVSPRLEPIGDGGPPDGSFLVRIVVVPPGSKELRVRVETVRGHDVAVRGLVMLRELLANAGAAQAVAAASQAGASTTPLPQAAQPRSPGRAVLALNTALFGGYVAYSVQKASGSDDPRVLYPLLALGTGVGLGSALLVAEEWSVGTGDAWFLAAGAWWGAGAGILFAETRDVQPITDRYTWGVGGGLLGLSLATAALSRGKIDEGGAALTHSGAALGLVFGGATQLLHEGTLEGAAPSAGAAWGTSIGLLAAGALATQVRVSPSRVFLVDLGAGLGGLAASALASPLLFEDVTPTKTRAFLGATLGGAVGGGVLAYVLTRDKAPPPLPTGFHVVPGLGPGGFGLSGTF